VFDKFRDDKGSFSKSLLCSNPRGLLSLYNAAHMAVTPEEKVLDDAIAFARSHLVEAMIGELRSPMVEQVSRSFDIPLPRFSRRLESMHYIAEYGQEEEGHDAQILELARLEFELVRSLHLRELREICR
jgi:eudesmane-5,11-diol synthase